MSRIRPERHSAAPLLDIASYARRGPGASVLSLAEIQQITRTVRRTPEVMVKVLSHGGKDVGAVGRHFDYLSRKGDLEIEADEGERFGGRNAGKAVLADWDLELETSRSSAALSAASRRHPPKLVHKLIFSMPAGTPPDKVYDAVKELCREQFALRHRYALVLHTDEPHPHVHVVVKAVSEQGLRLNIKKANLRAWRAAFAGQLRKRGIPANATDRAARGASGLRKTDPIYRAMQRGVSTHLREQLHKLARPTQQDERRRREGAARLSETRAAVMRGWRAVGEALERQGAAKLAAEVRAFASRLPPARTDQDLLESTRGQHLTRPAAPSPAEAGQPKAPEL